MLSTTIALIAYLFGGPGPEATSPTCDPIDTADPSVAREPYTDADRLDTYRRVRAECRRLGASSDACELAVAVAVRESSGRAGVRHRLSSDRAVAVRSWVAQASRYGWLVVDRGDGSGLHARPSAGADAPSPHYANPDRWSTGLGPHGLQPAIHLWRAGLASEPPEILCSPEVSTRVLLGIWYRAIHNYGARTWVEVNAIAAGSIVDNAPAPRAKQDSLFCARIERRGLDCEADASLGRFAP